jgi:prepilin-type N-terminal cleavage/methylation domain-containing protein
VGRSLDRSGHLLETSQRGVSFPELLVVISILALGAMVTIPLIADRIHQAKLDAAAGQYAVTLRAARMIAVSKQRSVAVTTRVAPDNVYEYVDASGRLRPTRLPDGAWFDPDESSAEVVFGPDGSLDDAARTVIKATMSGGVVEVWTIDVPLAGIPRVSHDIE